MENYKLRNYCFTAWKEPQITNTKDIKCYIYQKETTEDGKIHYQGYIEFKRPLRIKAIKKIFNDETMHIEIRQGTREQAINYCKKKDSKIGETVIYGKLNEGQGLRTDLKELGQLIRDGCKRNMIAREYTDLFIKYQKGITEAINELSKPKIWRNVKVYALWGESGAGKTKRAIERSKGGYFKLNTNTNGTLWFDGYKGEKTLIIDDFYGWIRWGELLTILDGYAYRCQIKGGYTWAKWKWVIITSNKEPKDWYKTWDEVGNKRDLAPLLRRIDKIIWMGRGTKSRGNTKPAPY